MRFRRPSNVKAIKPRDVLPDSLRYFIAHIIANYRAGIHDDGPDRAVWEVKSALGAACMLGVITITESHDLLKHYKAVIGGRIGRNM